MNVLPTANIILDTRRAKKDSTYPAKLRVIYERKYKDYAIGLSLTESDFAKVISTKPRGDYKEQKLFFNAIEERASTIIKDLPEFSFDAFEKNYLNKQDKQRDVYSYYQRRIEELTKDGSAGTVGVYRCAVTSLKGFHAKTLRFDKVTPDFLKEYERYAIAKGNSSTTISMYLRTLRTIYNIAIEDGVCKRENYPFGKRRYAVPASRNIKKALTLADIQKLFAYQPQNEAESKHRDLWLFSYLCSGINIKDIARLRYKDIEGGKLSFIRAKTKHTTRTNQRAIVVMLTEEAQSIIRRWGTTPVHPETFVFGYLSHDLDPERERKMVKQLTKTINKYIQRIAKAVGIEAHVTTYTARHSYATVLKRSGAPIEFISEALGHSNIRTTENYLDSFEDDTKRKYASALTAFN